MNSLSYAILGILSRKQQSGYELGKHLEYIWAAKLSQIYPLLAKLEEKEYVTSFRVEQTGKPDKINYQITDLGIETLKSWLRKKPNKPVTRDEFLTKVFSLWLTDLDNAIMLLTERENDFSVKLEKIKNDLVTLEHENGADMYNPSSIFFSRLILLKRRMRLCQDEVEWCQWVLQLLSKVQKPV
ncbi:PadR family transcriptional regulator [Bacillus sp. FJAT-29814]|uniref:PadR family transcriptional regulator n=1 Tax=Bacillus sp. FJAT-29814 TaxID=1729688 RepID=UPI000831E5FF|nr:PadR family transcriptional regulator [Bacillus sp. FJAT-29814]